MQRQAKFNSDLSIAGQIGPNRIIRYPQKVESENLLELSIQDTQVLSFLIDVYL